MSKTSLPILAAAALLLGGTAATLAFGGTTAARAQAPATAGAPTGSWEGGPVSPEAGGAPAYCVTQNQFDNGLVLVIARNPGGETNIALGIPGAELRPGERFALRLSVDGGVVRNLDGVVVDPAMMVIEAGGDAELYEALARGNRFTIQGPNDSTVFQLTGTAKALADLRSCAQRLAGTGARDGQAAAPTLPAPLRAILARSGLSEIQLMDMSRLPPERRPADFAWRFDDVFGGVRELNAPPDAVFTDLTQSYLDALKESCSGTFEAQAEPPTETGAVRMLEAQALCRMPDRALNVSLLFYLTDTNIFTVFFHEAEDAAKPRAVATRDSIAAVIREIAGRQPPAEAADPAPPAAEGN
ncbi:MAG TPA: hypothetical protein VK943_16410 [Arenibaculum sp.]|nr:hypothetical protein [Arenibaculum sp.]